MRCLLESGCKLRAALILLAAVAPIAVAQTPAAQTLVPTITLFNPTAISTAATFPLTLIVNGTNFVASSPGTSGTGTVITFNNKVFSTTFIDSNHVSIILASSDAAAAGNVLVVATNPGGTSSAPATITIVKPWGSRFTRIYAGIAVAEASSANSQAQLLVGVDTEADAWNFSGWNFSSKNSKGSMKTEPVGGVYFWLSPRITSLAQTNALTAAGIASGTFFTSALGGNPTQLVQALDFSAGPEIMFGDPTHAPGGGATTRFLPALIASFGLITPLSPSVIEQESVVYDNAVPNPHSGNNCDGSPIASGGTAPTMCSAVFVPTSSNRFLYRYNVGFRFKTYYYANDTLLEQYPGTVDLTFGKDQSITAGQFQGLAVRIEANYPIPFLQGLSVFGTIAMLPFSHPQVFPTTLLSPDSSLTATSPGVLQISVPPPNHDYFILGLAVDLARLTGH